MYIGLIPEKPVFKGEHMTLCWMGHNPDADDIILANILCRKINAWLDMVMPQFEIYERAILNGGHVAGMVRAIETQDMIRLQIYRDITNHLNMNRSELPFRPHITEGYMGKIEPTVRQYHYPFLFERAAYLR